MMDAHRTSLRNSFRLCKAWGRNGSSVIYGLLTEGGLKHSILPWQWFLPGNKRTHLEKWTFLKCSSRPILHANRGSNPESGSHRARAEVSQILKSPSA